METSLPNYLDGATTEIMYVVLFRLGRSATFLMANAGRTAVIITAPSML